MTDADGMLVWVRLGGAMMLGHGEIGQPLADALVGEYSGARRPGHSRPSAIRYADRDKGSLTGRRLIDHTFVSTLTQTREVCMSQMRRLTDELVRAATRDVADAGPMPGFDHFSR